MSPREPPSGTGGSFQALPIDILKSCLWPLLSSEQPLLPYTDTFLSSKDKRNVEALSLACGSDEGVAEGATGLDVVETHDLECGQGATGHDGVETLDLERGQGATGHDAVETLHLLCGQDATGHDVDEIPTLECSQGATWLDVLLSLEMRYCMLELDVFVLPHVSMLGLTKLEVLGSYDSIPFCWNSCLTIIEGAAKPPDGLSAALRVLPQLQDLSLEYLGFYVHAA
eukprot:gene16260-22437_t